jgi:CheY-like chemotaxis protein/anti-sigma regulatory factor (Ser/Thr protein kinase)
MSSHVTDSRIMQTKKGSILAVDDNPVILNLLVKILEQENYTISAAVNGKEALQHIKADPAGIDIILLDRMMPGMDGMEVIRRMKEDAELRDIPIIMQTAADKPEEISAGIKAGVFYYLTKPVERETLLSVVSAAIRKAKRQKTLRAEMRRHRMSFGLIKLMKSQFQTLDEGESLASFLAGCFPDPDRALSGISEIMINAVEHGNLGISYEEKTKLMEEHSWRDEVNRRLEKQEYADKQVTVVFEKKKDAYYLQVTDEGEGFNWKNFMELSPSRASHNHGRGIAVANMIVFDRLVYNEKGNQVTAIMNISDSTTEGETDDYWS